MAVTPTTRLGLNNWGAGGDTFTRVQMNADHTALDTKTAIYLQSTAGTRPAAGIGGRYHFATDTKVVTYDDGVSWRTVTGGASNDGTKLLSLGGNLTVSGAYATTLTVSNTTNVTLPTSGTLVNDAVTALNSLVSVDTTSTTSHTFALGTGATASGQTKTVNLGGGGLTGSTTAITLGPTAGTVTVTLNGLVSLANTADTATAATHYFVETGTDGYLRPKTLANVKTEVVTTAAVNSAAATTVGTVTSGTWQGSLIDGQRGGTGVANTGKTITVSGNTTIGSSTHTVALATTGNTSVTLPVSGVVVATTAPVTDNAIARFNGTGGAVQNSGVTIDDSNNLTAGGLEMGAGGPTITSGSGAPSHSAPNGSSYHRTDGTVMSTLYVRAAGGWWALSPGGN